MFDMCSGGHGLGMFACIIVLVEGIVIMLPILSAIAIGYFLGRFLFRRKK